MDTERRRQEEDAEGEKKIVGDEMWPASKVEGEGTVRHRMWASHRGELSPRSSRGKSAKLT